MIDRTLYVVAVISNPIRYQSRSRLFKAFAERMRKTGGVQLVVVEQAFGDRAFEHTSQDNRFDIQLRAGAESLVWVKEAMINIALRHLAGQAPHWQYAAWIDGDVEFRRANWATETVEALQHFKIVQPWRTAVDLGPNGEALQLFESFCATWWHERDLMCGKGYVGQVRHDGLVRAHPGYAWAMRRDIWEKLAPLIDFNPMGSGDHQMAWAMVGQHHKSVDSRFDAEYKRRVREFADKCDRHLRKDIGYVDGQLLHHYHGPKKKRFYVERTKALLDSGFNVARDLKHNAAGLLVLTGANLKLRDVLREYMRARDEDDCATNEFRN